MAETQERNHRKVRQGLVTSLAGEKTITVTIHERKQHPKYKKMITRTKKLHAHDEKGEADGDRGEGRVGHHQSASEKLEEDVT